MIMKDIKTMENFVDSMNGLLNEKLDFKPFEFDSESSCKDTIKLVLNNSNGVKMSNGYDSTLNVYQLIFYLNAKTLKEIYEKLDNVLSSFYETLNNLPKNGRDFLQWKVDTIKLVSTDKVAIKQINSHYQIKYSVIVEILSCLS